MLVFDRATGCLADEHFEHLPQLLRAGDLLILNDSRVLPARIFATRAGIGTQANSPRPAGLIEVLLTEEVEDQSDADPTSRKRDAQPSEQARRGPRDAGHPPSWRALVKPAKKVRVGETLEFRGVDGIWRSARRWWKRGSLANAPCAFRRWRISMVLSTASATCRCRPTSSAISGHSRYGRGPGALPDRVLAPPPAPPLLPLPDSTSRPEVLAALAARGVEIAYAYAARRPGNVSAGAGGAPGGHPPARRAVYAARGHGQRAEPGAGGWPQDYSRRDYHHADAGTHCGVRSLRRPDGGRSGLIPARPRCFLLPGTASASSQGS